MAQTLTKLSNKVALVTGASSGIGLATAKLLASQGARVAISGRNSLALEKLAKEIGGGESKTFICVADVTAEEDVNRMVQSTVDHFGQIDMLINSAGILKGGTIQDTTLETFDANMNTNVRSVFMTSKAVIPHLAKTKGSIVNVSSVNGLQAFGGVAAYCASKAAVDQLTRCAAVDLAAMGIRVNAVNPGVTRSELQKRGGLSDENYQAFLERSKVTHPLGRIAEPEEVAEAIVFLADNNTSSFITGACVPVDGGRACLGAR